MLLQPLATYLAPNLAPPDPASLRSTLARHASHPHGWLALICLTVALLALSLLIPQHSIAAPGAANKLPVGFVIISRGEALRIAENQESQALKRRSKIFSGDEVRTGPTGGLQIKFKDGSIIALQANTRLQISHFHFTPQGSSSRSFFQLLEGGIRAISGAIGKQNPEQYRMKTPIATIGIRGTHYAVALGEEMYVGVWEGGIKVSNSAGALDLGSDVNYQYAAIAGRNDKPKGLLQPPEAITQLMNQIDLSPTEESSSTEDQATTTDAATERRRVKRDRGPNLTYDQRAELAARAQPIGPRNDGAASAETTLADVVQTNIAKSLIGDIGGSTESNSYPRANFPLSSVLSFSARGTNEQQEAFSRRGVLAGAASVGSDPRLLLYPDNSNLATDPLPTPRWIVSNADATTPSLSLVGLQSQLIPEGVTFGRWNLDVTSTLSGDQSDFSLLPAAFWLTSDLSIPLAASTPQQYRVTMPLFFSADTHQGSDALRLAHLDLAIDFNNPSTITGKMALISQGANGTYDTERWDLNLTGSLSDRQLQMQVTSATSTLDQAGSSSDLDGELRGYLVDDGTSFVGNVTVWEATGNDLWLNGIIGATGIETRLSDKDSSAYADSPAISLAASVSNNNPNITSPLFRHDEGVFAGPAVIDGSNNLLRLADLWRMERYSSSEFLGVEYFIGPGTVSGLLLNVTPIDPVSNGITLPQMPSLHLVNTWSEAVFAYDPLDSTATQTAPTGERLVWLLSRPASLNDLSSTRTSLFDTVAYGYFEDASAVSGKAFTFTVDSSALADFDTGTLRDFSFSIRTATHQYDIKVPEGYFQDAAGNNAPGIDLADAGVRGTVCDLADCANTQRQAHGEVRLSFLENGQSLGGSLKLWDDNNLDNWVSGVFTLAEDIRLNTDEVNGLQQGFYAFTAQANDTITDTPTFTLSGSAITGEDGAPTLIKDTQASVEGTLLRNGSVTNTDVGVGTIGGHTVSWGKWNTADTGSPTVVSDFVNTPGNYDEDIYWISARPTAESQLPVGIVTYDQEIRMLGQLNGKPLVTNPTSGTNFNVNFNTMTMSGALGLSNGASQNATLNITGSLDGAILRADTIQVEYDGHPVRSAISEFNGAIIGDRGEGLTGAWHSHSRDPAFNSTSGVFVVEQQ